MNLLKRKMFWVLFLVLSLLIFTLMSLMVYREYSEIRQEIEGDLITSGRLLERVSKDYTVQALQQDDEQLKSFKDRLSEPLSLTSSLPTYIVVNNANRISQVFFYNTDGQDLDQVYELAGHILSTDHEGEMSFENFWSSDYVWDYKHPGILTIMDVVPVRRQLFELVFFWLILFGAALLLIYWLCRVLVRWMIAPIEEAFMRQKQFIADASHELKTPLAVIYSNTQAFERDQDPKWIHNIQNETNRMNGLITDLLELTRMEQTGIKKVPFNLSKLVQKEALALEAVMFEKGILLEEDIEPDLQIDGNEDQIRQVVLILLDNAIHHASSWIRASLSAKGNEITLTISNNGNPIPPKDLPHIFERFYRSEESRNRNENRFGLGLAIAKNIIDLHDGNISVESTEKETAFSLHFRRVNG